MARAYSDDLRARVIDMVGAGASARASAARFGVGVSTAIVWIRRARQDGERLARRQGKPRGSCLDPHKAFSRLYESLFDVGPGGVSGAIDTRVEVRRPERTHPPLRGGECDPGPDPPPLGPAGLGHCHCDAVGVQEGEGRSRSEAVRHSPPHVV